MNDPRPTLPPVSVVIRAKNEAADIGKTLAALFDGTALQPVRVILVDSGSTDGTLAIARRFPVQIVEIPQEAFTYGFALNLGVRHAPGEIIATLSAHSLPANVDWLRHLVEPFADPRVAGVYGRQLPRANATTLERLGMVMTGLNRGKPHVHRARPFFSNANAAFRRTAWEHCPFDEEIGGGEDMAWARCVQDQGYLIAYQPTAMVYHSHGEPTHRHLRRIVRDAPGSLGSYLRALPASINRRPGTHVGRMPHSKGPSSRGPVRGHSV